MLRKLSEKSAGHERFLRMAIEEAKSAIASGDGRAFGGVMVRSGALICRGHNEVDKRRDPTAHAEIVLIQNVCRYYNQPVLPDGCKLYLSAEPCPMCLIACLQCNVECIFYAASAEQCSTANNGAGNQYELQKDFLTKIVDEEWKSGYVKQILSDEANEVFH